MNNEITIDAAKAFGSRKKSMFDQAIHSAHMLIKATNEIEIAYNASRR